MGDGAGADESDVGEAWMGGQIGRCLGPAGNALNELGRMSASLESGSGNRDEVITRPRCAF